MAVELEEAPALVTDLKALRWAETERVVVVRMELCRHRRQLDRYQSSEDELEEKYAKDIHSSTAYTNSK